MRYQRVLVTEWPVSGFLMLLNEQDRSREKRILMLPHQSH